MFSTLLRPTCSSLYCIHRCYYHGLCVFIRPRSPPQNYIIKLSPRFGEKWISLGAHQRDKRDLVGWEKRRSSESIPLIKSQSVFDSRQFFFNYLCRNSVKLHPRSFRLQKRKGKKEGHERVYRKSWDNSLIQSVQVPLGERGVKERWEGTMRSEGIVLEIRAYRNGNSFCPTFRSSRLCCVCIAAPCLFPFRRRRKWNTGINCETLIPRRDQQPPILSQI